MVRHAHYRTGDRDGSRRCSGRCHLVVRCCESFPVGQIEDPKRTWAYSRTAWCLSFRPASDVRIAHCPHNRSGIDVRVVDRAGTSRLDRTPARTTDLVRRSHAHDGTARLSEICEARSRASYPACGDDRMYDLHHGLLERRGPECVQAAGTRSR